MPITAPRGVGHRRARQAVVDAAVEADQAIDRRRRARSATRPPARLTMPALAIASPSPLRPTAIAKWPAWTPAASPSATGGNRALVGEAKQGEVGRRVDADQRRLDALAVGADQRDRRRRAAKDVRRGDDEAGPPDDRRTRQRARRPMHGDGAGADAVDDLGDPVRVGAERIGGGGGVHGRGVAMRRWPKGTPRLAAANPPNGGAACPLGREPGVRCEPPIARRARPVQARCRRSGVRRPVSARPDRDSAARRAAPSRRRAGAA